MLRCEKCHLAPVSVRTEDWGSNMTNVPSQQLFHPLMLCTAGRALMLLPKPYYKYTIGLCQLIGTCVPINTLFGLKDVLSEFVLPIPWWSIDSSFWWTLVNLTPPWRVHMSAATHWASLQPPGHRKPCRPHRNAGRPRRSLASASCFGIPEGSTIFLESTNFPGEDRKKQGYEKILEHTHF